MKIVQCESEMSVDRMYCPSTDEEIENEIISRQIRAINNESQIIST